MTIRINRGDIEIFGITGVIEKTHFHISISCAEKYIEASDHGDSFALCVDKGRTMRGAKVLQEEGPKGPTWVHLDLGIDPWDWDVTVKPSGYGVTITGVYCPMSEAKNIKFSLAD